MYDVAIIGMGPAGATLARLLNPGLKVMIVDRKDRFNRVGGVTKCCGGLLALDAQKALAKFKLTLPLSVLVDPQIFAVRTIDLNSGLERYYQRFYINLDRSRFDAWLASLVPETVDVFDNALCQEVRQEKDGSYRVVFTRDGESLEKQARIVVGADGANSIVRRTFYAGVSKIRRYIAIQEWYEHEGMSPFYSSIFDDTLTDCYAWTISKNNQLIIGAALPKDNPLERLAKLKLKLTEKGFVFNHCVKREGCLVYRPASLRSFCTGSNGALLVGEAAGFISPSSLEGLSYAIDSGFILACVLNEGLANAAKRYAWRTLPTRLKLLLKIGKTPFMYNRWLRRLVMLSGLDSIEIFEKS